MIEQDSSLVDQLTASDQLIHTLTTEMNDLKMLVNSLDGVLWTMNPESGQILYMSSQVERILGYTPEQVKSVSRFIDSKIVPEDLKVAREQYCQLSQQKDNFQIEYRMLNATDDIVYMCTIYSVGRDEHGKGVIVRGFSTDVTQYKQMAERHRSMEVELRQAHKLEAVGQLAAGSSTAADKPVNICSTSLDRIGK